MDFQFTYVFDQKSSQEEVFKTVAQPVIDK
jgi:hypothetical protein